MDPKTKKSTPQATRDILQVEVRNPDKILFSGTAVAISSKNNVGPLDILPQHENFISLLSDKITIYQDKHQKQEIPNTSAIIKAKLNKVNIFLGIETLNAGSPTPPAGKNIPKSTQTKAPQPVNTATSAKTQTPATSRAKTT